MVRPTKPKEIKPKAEVKAPAEPGKDSGFGGMKLIAVNTVVTLIICVLFIASNYFIVQNSLAVVMKQINGAASEEGGGGEGDGTGEEVERGLILDLGEFILNLSDPKARRYLKVNVALELSRTETDPDPAAGGGGHGGGHGEAANPMQQIEAEMSQFKPAIRDAVISTLSSKTAEEVSSIAGKELAKEQIKESVDAVFAGEREVLRVSFGNFIIQ